MEKIEQLKEIIKDIMKDGFVISDNVTLDDVYSDDFYYDLFDGGYINIDKILKKEEQKELINIAINIISLFNSFFEDKREEFEELEDGR